MKKIPHHKKTEAILTVGCIRIATSQEIIIHNDELKNINKLPVYVFDAYEGKDVLAPRIIQGCKTITKFINTVYNFNHK